MDPRGIRNNNPGNIRRTDIEWEGMAPEQPDPEFVTFQDPVYGVRALGRVLNTYYEKHGLSTVADIINRWAPPNENNTDAYVKSVAAQMGLPANAPLDMKDPQVVARLAKAIIHHENGVQPYDDDTIMRGLRLAGVFRFDEEQPPGKA